MKYIDLLQVYFERTNAFETLWTIYASVVGALLAFFATRDRLDRRLLFIFIVGFLAFATVNLSALCDTMSERIGLNQAILDFVPTEETSGAFASLRASVGNHLPKLSVTALVVFHVTCDILVAAVIWIIARGKPASDVAKPQNAVGLA